MKHKVAELEGALLDAAVAMAEGRLVTEADEPQPGYVLKKREEWGEHFVRWYAHDEDGAETGEVGGFEPLSSWGSPSTDWAVGGPIIERERIGVWSGVEPYSGEPAAGLWYAEGAGTASNRAKSSGPTSLIAAMRAYVASKLGQDVDL